MKTNCWIDVFDLRDFAGEHRRFFGPSRLELSLLGMTAGQPFSLRVGDGAAVWLQLKDGSRRALAAGEGADALDPDSIVAIDVRE